MRAIWGTHSFASYLKFILALVWLPALPVSAGQVPASSMEFPVWSRTWGALGSTG